jgi:hypothetical protein
MTTGSFICKFARKAQPSAATTGSSWAIAAMLTLKASSQKHVKKRKDFGAKGGDVS